MTREQLPSITKTIVQGASTLPPFDLTVTADSEVVTFRWRAVCFPKCKDDFIIKPLEKFFEDFGFQPDQYRGLTRMSMTFSRKAMCQQSKVEVAAIRCSARNSPDRLIHMSFSKENGITFDFDNHVTGYFDAVVATRVVRGFTKRFAPPYMRYDVYVSAVGRKINDPDSAAYSTFEMLGLQNHCVVVNGIQNP